MVALFACVALAFAACGLGLIAVGVGLAVDGSVGAGLISAACGALTLYGTYLFVVAVNRSRAEGIALTAALGQGARDALRFAWHLMP